jgi:signal transduction histidine kinase
MRTHLQPAPVKGDGVLLERLAQNLIDNAIRYNLRERGEITVTTERIDDSAHLTVVNTGPAIPPYEIPSLFDPFRRVPTGERRADSSSASGNRGAGLGLSIVRSVAHAHGGDVRASPREGGGLSIGVWLPMAPERSLPAGLRE